MAHLNNIFGPVFRKTISSNPMFSIFQGFFALLAWPKYCDSDNDPAHEKLRTDVIFNKCYGCDNSIDEMWTHGPVGRKKGPLDSRFFGRERP